MTTRINRFIAATVMTSMLCACTHEKASDAGNKDSEETYDEYQYLTDSVEGLEVTHDCAIAHNKYEVLKWRWEGVKAPLQLAHYKSTWQKDIENIEKAGRGLSEEEVEIINGHISELKLLYSQRCSELELPASGIIANLQELTRELRDVKSRSDLAFFKEGRTGMLNELDIIHLCVDHKSADISKVRHLAQQLQGEYQNKCRLYGNN